MSIFLYTSLLMVAMSATGCRESEHIITMRQEMQQLNFKPNLTTWRDQLSAIEELQAHLNQRKDDRKMREIKYQAVKKLEYLAHLLPQLSDIFQLKSAQLFYSLGESERALALMRGLFDKSPEVQRAVAPLFIDYAMRCENLEEGLMLISELEPTVELQRARAWAQLKLSVNCQSPEQIKSAQRQVAMVDPRRLSTRELLKISRESDTDQAFKLIRAWEADRLPRLGIEALTELIKRDGLSRETRWEAKFERARLQVDRARDQFKEAAETMRALQKRSGGSRDKARLLLARALAKLNQPRDAQRIYLDIMRDKSGDSVDKARFNYAFLAYEAGDYRRAARSFKKLCRHRGKESALKRLKTRAKDFNVRSSEWYYAWSLFQRDPARAAPFLEAQIGEGLPISAEGRRAAYWAAQAYQERDPERAQALRAQLLQADWGDWYALLLRAQDPTIAPDRAPWPDTPSIERPTRHPSLVRSSTPTTSPAKISQIEIFAQKAEVAQILDLPTLQTAYLDRARVELKHHLSTTSDPESELVQWGYHLNLHYDLLRWALSKSSLKYRMPPELRDARWWRLMYPHAYSEIVSRTSARFRVPSELILSFIYKESAFRPSVISPAYAMGLMQLLEKTARALHPDAPPPQLVKPAENIKLGVEYLALLSQRFHGQLPIMAAAYNAGPKSVVRWLKRSESRQTSDLDRFVELIPFREARGYVKRLIALNCAYSLLYGGASVNQCAQELPLKINTRVEPGVNF